MFFNRDRRDKILNSLKTTELKAHYELAESSIAAMIERHQAGEPLNVSLMGFYRRERAAARSLLTERGAWQEKPQAPVAQQAPAQRTAWWIDTTEGQAWTQMARRLRIAESLSSMASIYGTEDTRDATEEANHLADRYRTGAMTAYRTGIPLPEEVTIPELERIAAAMHGPHLKPPVC